MCRNQTNVLHIYQWVHINNKRSTDGKCENNFNGLKYDCLIKISVLLSTTLAGILNQCYFCYSTNKFTIS